MVGPSPALSAAALPVSDLLLLAGGIGAIVLVLVLALGVLPGMLGRRRTDRRLRQLAQATERLMTAHGDLAGRLAQSAEVQGAATAQLEDRLHTQERRMIQLLDERLAEVSRRVGEGLERSGTRTAETMADLQARLAVIDTAQAQIADLGGRMSALQSMLSNKQARGAFGQVQMEDLVRDALPPGAYRFQGALSNGRIADCLLLLPNPPGVIALDAKYPLEAFRALQAAETDSARKQAEKAFAADMRKHITDIADRYILPGETADSALLFLPSEAVYGELHAHFPAVVEESHRARVWIVSPTTLMATLTTVRAVLKDAHIREQTDVIRREVSGLLDDLRKLDDRTGALARHIAQAEEDIRQIRLATERLTRRGGRIDALDLRQEALDVHQGGDPHQDPRHGPL